MRFARAVKPGGCRAALLFAAAANRTSLLALFVQSKHRSAYRSLAMFHDTPCADPRMGRAELGAGSARQVPRASVGGNARGLPFDIANRPSAVDSETTYLREGGTGCARSREAGKWWWCAVS